VNWLAFGFCAKTGLAFFVARDYFMCSHLLSKGFLVVE
jgi:hypothetical protein